jgi:predicted RNA-binding protein with PIN domain
VTEQTAPDDDSPSDDPAVPDAVLRSALEFAVGLAAAGRKIRPPLKSPSGLRPFLKAQAVPRQGLAVIRAAIVGDPLFRRRVASVAPAELVDDVGRCWLEQAPGWQQRVQQLRADVASAGSVDGPDAHDVSVERRRRLAAESAAQRALADLAIARGERDDARRERDVHELTVRRTSETGRRSDESTRQAGAQIERLRGDVQRVTAERDAALSDAERLRRALDDAQATRDRLLRERVEQADLRGALAAARDQLDSLLGSLAARTPDSKRPATRRQPVAIPGGLAVDHRSAVEHVLRSPGVEVLVDGYNVAKLGWPGTVAGARESGRSNGLLERQRAALVDACEQLATTWGVAITVVFDGADVVVPSAVRRLVRVVFSPPGVLADDSIRTAVGQLPVTTPVVVVTDDGAIRADVRAAGCNLVTSAAFLVVLRR